MAAALCNMTAISGNNNGMHTVLLGTFANGYLHEIVTLTSNKHDWSGTGKIVDISDMLPVRLKP